MAQQNRPAVDTKTRRYARINEQLLQKVEIALQPEILDDDATLFHVGREHAKATMRDVFEQVYPEQCNWRLR